MGSKRVEQKIKFMRRNKRNLFQPLASVRASKADPGGTRSTFALPNKCAMFSVLFLMCINVRAANAKLLGILTQIEEYHGEAAVLGLTDGLCTSIYSFVTSSSLCFLFRSQLNW